MATDGKYPAYVEIEYHSPFSTHTMTLMMRAIASSGIGDPGVVETWSGGSIATDDMVESMIDTLALAVPSTIVYDNYTIFTVPTPTADPQPLYTKLYSVTGSETGLTGQAKATQVTLSFRTEAFGQARIVFLDRPANGNYGSFVDPLGDMAGVIAEFTDPLKAWSGRDNFRPAAYTNTSISLNKRLRRKYGMI